MRRIRPPHFLPFVLLFLAACSGASPPSERASTQESSILPTPTIITAVKSTVTPIPLFSASFVGGNGPNGEYLPSDTLQVYFNQPVIDTELGPPGEIYPFIQGEWSWDDDHQLATFQPEAAFLSDHHYSLILREDLMSIAGLLYAGPGKIKINIAEPPSLVSHSPGSANLGTNQRPSILIRFSQPMEVSSIETSIHISPSVDYSVSSPSQSEYRIKILEDLSVETRYRFSIDTSAVDLNGVNMLEDYYFEYWVDGLEYTLKTPGIGDSHQRIEFGFNYELDPSSVSQSLVFNPAIAGNWRWSSTKRLIFEPQDSLPFDTEVTIDFKDPVKQLDGNMLPAPNEQTFNTPPPILDYSPGFGDDDYGDYVTQISIQFSEAMDFESAEASFNLSPSVPGFFSWSENTLQYNLQTTLSPYTRYTINLTPGIRNYEGEVVLRRPFSWSFDSGYMSSIGHFGILGAKIQVVDTDGLRPIQFGLMTNDRTRVIFGVHALDYGQYSRLSALEPGFRSPSVAELNIPDDPDYEFEITANYPGEETNIRQAFIPEDIPPGIYLLTMAIDGQQQDQIVVVLTSYSLVVKHANEQLLVWAVNIHGNSVENLSIRVYDSQGRHILNGSTDENGFYESPVNPEIEPGMVLAYDDEGDTTTAGVDPIWGSYISYGWRFYSRGTALGRASHAYIFTERPIYRPDQIVYFKAILRRDLDAIYRVPEINSPVQIEIFDARENLLQTFHLQTNIFGTINGSYHIPQGAALGEYRLVATFANEETEQVFKVEDYRKPDIQLSIQANHEQYVAGEAIQLEFDASYFFGQPVANAAITVRKFQLGEFYGYWWDEDPQEEPTYIWYKMHGRERVLVTDENGHATLTLKAEMGDEYYRRRYWPSNLESSTEAIEVTIDDGSHQNVSQFVVFKVFTARERLVLDTGGYLHQADERIPITATLETISGEPINARDLKLNVLAWNRWSSEYKPIQGDWSAETDLSGEAKFNLLNLDSGHYRIEVESIDDEGNRVSSRRWFGIYVDSGRWSWTHSNEQLVINFDQDQYSPYNQATAYIESTIDGLALVTLERGRIHHREVIELTPPITEYEFTVVESFAPNIFMNVSVWQPASQDYTGQEYEWIWTNIPEANVISAKQEIAVEVIGKQLDLTILTDQEKYTPGDEANVTIRVTDDDGNPVTAEVSVAVVDEAIYALSNELSVPIFDAYYSRRSLAVGTFDSMGPERWIHSPDRGGGGDGYPDPANIRSEFPDTAAWYPALQTDSRGEVSVNISLPDSLTTWRIVSKAVTLSTSVAENTATVITQKPLLVRPILPRVVTSSDAFDLSASVHNYSQQTQEVTVGYSSESFPSLDKSTQKLTMEPGETAFIGWSVVAEIDGAHELIFWAESETEEDAVSVILPVQALAVPEVVTQIGQFVGQTSLDLYIPDAASPSSSVKIELSPSLTGNLASGLEYLTGFPYGCVEQIMSRALPNATVGRVFRALGAEELIQRSDLDSKVREGVASLYAMQHADGGWGWWYDDASHDYQTAWVVFGLALTSDGGYDVDPEVLERGAHWLENNLNAMDTRTRAFALYSMALAGHGNLSQTRMMVSQAAELDTFSLAALTLALHDLRAHSDASQLLHLIEGRAERREGRAYWITPNEDGHYYKKTMASSIRTTALSLEALVRVGGNDNLIADSVRWLLAQRGRSGWGTTNETAFTLLALGDYLLQTTQSSDSLDYSVTLNGVLLDKGKFSANQPRITLDLPLESLERGENKLEINTADDQEIYYTLSSRILIPEATVDADGTIVVARSYHDPRTGERVERANAGELVEVQLLIQWPDNLFYVLIEDHLPGGLEALNERLNSESRDIDPDGERRFYWQDLGYNYKDVRGDTVSFFITETSETSTHLRYTTRAARAGSFTALPTEVYPMYDLATWGRSASAEFSVNEFSSTNTQARPQ